MRTTFIADRSIISMQNARQHSPWGPSRFLWKQEGCTRNHCMYHTTIVVVCIGSGSVPSRHFRKGISVLVISRSPRDRENQLGNSHGGVCYIYHPCSSVMHTAPLRPTVKGSWRRCNIQPSNGSRSVHTPH